jgi:hypothetical protein
MLGFCFDDAAHATHSPASRGFTAVCKHFPLHARRGDISSWVSCLFAACRSTVNTTGSSRIFMFDAALTATQASPNCTELVHSGPGRAWDPPNSYNQSRSRRLWFSPATSTHSTTVLHLTRSNVLRLACYYRSQTGDVRSQLLQSQTVTLVPVHSSNHARLDNGTTNASAPQRSRHCISASRIAGSFIAAAYPPDRRHRRTGGVSAAQTELLYRRDWRQPIWDSTTTGDPRA